MIFQENVHHCSVKLVKQKYISLRINVPLVFNNSYLWCSEYSVDITTSEGAVC